MGIKRRLAEAAGYGMVQFARLLGHQFLSYTVNRFMEHPDVVRWTSSRYGNIGLWSPNELTLWRAQTLLSKEPETIEWIDGFSADEVYWDIGANVGVYALYAAKRGDLQVVAFEPSPFNYYALCRNVASNNLSQNVAAYCLAFNDNSTLDYLNMTTTEIGGALSNFGEATGYWGQAMQPVFRQAMIGMSVDEFIERFNVPFPNHIKIDVDGIEAKIVTGAHKTLSDSRLRSVLIELDEKRVDEVRHVSEALGACGLKLLQRRHSELIEHSEFSSSYNFIFAREH